MKGVEDHATQNYIIMIQPSNCSVPLHPLSGENFGSYVGTMTQWGTMICGGSGIRQTTPLKN